MTERIYYDLIEQNDWSFYIAATEKGLCFVGSSPANQIELQEWVEQLFPDATLIQDSDKTHRYQEQLQEYLKGERLLFTLPLEVKGTTFQKQVWREIQKIPYGKTRTYGDIAQALGKSAQSSRAVGTAVGKNPLLMLCPCHRVLPKQGPARGFRGGLEMKQALLDLEKTVTSQ